jgi:cytoskeletal protein RodZ
VDQHFGNFLKQRREERGLSLSELSRATKIKESLLELVEEADVERLPAPVFVRGFVVAYARAVGADELEAMRRLKHYMSDRAAPPPIQALPPGSITQVEGDGEGGEVGRKRVGVVMVVLLILVVATLTLSLLLRHGRGASEGLSQISPDSTFDVSA